jgi:hypothetical protein
MRQTEGNRRYTTMRKFTFILLLALAACQAPLRSAEAADGDPPSEICSRYGFFSGCSWDQLFDDIKTARPAFRERIIVVPSDAPTSCESYWERNSFPEIFPDRWITKCK